MDRRLMLAALLAVAAGALLVTANWCLADEPKAAPAADKPAETAPADTQQTPEGTSTEDTKKTDKYLGIDWGDDKKDKPAKDDPDAAQPETKIDLAAALNDAQAKRLEYIKTSAAKGDKMAELAQATLEGKNKNLKKEAAIKQFEAAAGIFQKAMTDTESLARAITDRDTKLTLLREYADAYRKQACEMLCKAGRAAIEMAGDNVSNLRLAVEYFKRAYRIDPDYPGIKEGVEAARSAFTDLTTRIAEAKKQSAGGGGGDDPEKDWDANERARKAQQEGRTDYSKRGRGGEGYAQ